MSQKDLYHNAAIIALIADGWQITHDPLTITYGRRNLFVDLGAEQPIGAEKEGYKIAVEIKSFVGPSDINELQSAVGQYNLYRDILAETEPDRELYMAIPSFAFDGIFSEPVGQLTITRQRLKLIVFSDKDERIIQWII